MSRWRLASVGAGALLCVSCLVLAPAAALAGWRVAFVAAGSVPVGAVMLLLIARLTGARWGAALPPLAALTWLLLPAFVPLVIQQALVVDRPEHLRLWLSWPLFAARGLAAIALWWWLARALAKDAVSPLGAGLALVAHGVLLTIVGTDWLFGTSPAQPESAVAMVLATMEVLAACGAACLLRLGEAEARRDLSFLLIAGALGLPYLLFMDFLIVWFGDLPGRIGWYVARTWLPWVMLPPLALALGLMLPIACIALVRTDHARRIAGAGALAALVLAAAWIVGPPAPLGAARHAGRAFAPAGRGMAEAGGRSQGREDRDAVPIGTIMLAHADHARAAAETAMSMTVRAAERPAPSTSPAALGVSLPATAWRGRAA